MKQGDHSGVVVLPPLLYGVAFAAVLFLDWAWPLALPDHPAIRWTGRALLILGSGLNAWAAWAMYRARTPINPYRPVTFIITTGPFRLTRNPLYVGLDLIFAGLALMMQTAWGLILLVPVVFVTHYGIVLREERYLADRFGEAYRRYCSEVRRYL